MTSTGTSGASLPLVAVTLVLLTLLVWLVARFAAYKASHPYTDADVKRARQEAIAGSRRTRGGQAAEQLAPFLPALCDRFNPKDARFLGNPVDFIVFDGLDEGHLREVVFVEIKTGAAKELNKNESEVSSVIGERRVAFEVVTPLTYGGRGPRRHP